MKWGGEGGWGEQGGAVGCREGKAEETTELENGDRAWQGVPEGFTCSPKGHPALSPYRDAPLRAIHPLQGRDGHHQHTVGSSGAASTPHPTPASRGMQDRGMPKAKASHSSGYPLTPGREVPPAPRLGPGSGRAVGTVSISRGALLEKEQKPREAINSLLLLHTSASSAPASRGGREGPRAWPGLSPTAKPPPRLRANISI